jgi:hypothetical protein
MKRAADWDAYSDDNKPKLTRTNSSVLIVAQHPDLGAGARIRLRPLISVVGGTISGIEVSGRTPSPFGKSMGDHTVAWQVLVDSVHANLYAQPVAAAIARLRTAQDGVAGWMFTAGSLGMQLLRDIDDDIPGRRARLEDAAWWVNTHLDTARSQLAGATPERAAFPLAQALACHLAYLNYLPFATVRAKSERGSHGSAEGWHRGVLVAWETGRRKARADEEKARDDWRKAHNDASAVTPAELKAETARQARVAADTERLRAGQAPNLRDTLWSLFDVAAAMRAAQLEYVLNPGVATAVKQVVTNLNQLAGEVRQIAAELDPGTARLTTAQHDQLTRIRDAAAGISAAATDSSIIAAAGLLRDGVNTFIDGQSESQARTRRSRAASAADGQRVTAALTAAGETAAGLKTEVDAAPERAARVLTYLLHKHMRAVAAAYPDSVTDSEFLQPNASAAAISALMAAMQRDYRALLTMPAASPAVTTLTGKVAAEFGTVTVAADNAWVAAAGRDPLVVTWDETAVGGARLIINGRAEAPPGVAGMGSHTTAWVQECLALRSLLRDAVSGAAVITIVQEAAEEDLSGQVITLDRALPADQLEGGQVALMFAAAADVLTAAEAGEAARAFLRFRNLLPFATVDAGSRAGHGEDEDTSLKDSYDKDSLDDAVGLVRAALLNEDEHKRMAAALGSAATNLVLNSWPDAVKTAAKKSRSRLKARSVLLSKQVLDSSKLRDDVIAADAAQTAAIIGKLRWEEHVRVYRTAHPS